MATPDEFAEGFDAATDFGAMGRRLAAIARAVVDIADERSVLPS